MRCLRWAFAGPSGHFFFAIQNIYLDFNPEYHPKLRRKTPWRSPFVSNFHQRGIQGNLQAFFQIKLSVGATMDYCLWFCWGQRNLGQDISKTSLAKHIAKQKEYISSMTPIFLLKLFPNTEADFPHSFWNDFHEHEWSS